MFNGFKDPTNCYGNQPLFENCNQPTFLPCEGSKQTSAPPWDYPPQSYNNVPFYSGDQHLNHRLPSTIIHNPPVLPQFDRKESSLNNNNNVLVHYSNPSNNHQTVVRPTALINCQSRGNACCNHPARIPPHWSSSAENVRYLGNPTLTKDVPSFPQTFLHDDTRFRSTDNFATSLNKLSKFPRDTTSTNHTGIGPKPIKKSLTSPVEHCAHSLAISHEDATNGKCTKKDSCSNCQDDCRSSCRLYDHQAEFSNVESVSHELPHPVTASRENVVRYTGHSAVNNGGAMTPSCSQWPTNARPQADVWLPNNPPPGVWNAPPASFWMERNGTQQLPSYQELTGRGHQEATAQKKTRYCEAVQRKAMGEISRYTDSVRKKNDEVVQDMTRYQQDSVRKSQDAYGRYPQGSKVPSTSDSLQETSIISHTSVVPAYGLGHDTFPSRCLDTNSGNTHNARAVHTNYAPYARNKLAESYTTGIAQPPARFSPHMTYTQSKISRNSNDMMLSQPYNPPLPTNFNEIPGNNFSSVTCKLSTTNSSPVNMTRKNPAQYTSSNDIVVSTVQSDIIRYGASKEPVDLYNMSGLQPCNKMSDNIVYGKTMQVVDNFHMDKLDIKNVNSYGVSKGSLNPNSYQPVRNRVESMGYNMFCNHNSQYETSTTGLNMLALDSGVKAQDDVASVFSLSDDCTAAGEFPGQEDSVDRPIKKRKSRLKGSVRQEQSDNHHQGSAEPILDVRQFLATWDEESEDLTASPKVPEVSPLYVVETGPQNSHLMYQHVGGPVECQPSQKGAVSDSVTVKQHEVVQEPLRTDNKVISSGNKSNDEVNSLEREGRAHPPIVQVKENIDKSLPLKINGAQSLHNKIDHTDRVSQLLEKISGSPDHSNCNDTFELSSKLKTDLPMGKNVEKTTAKPDIDQNTIISKLRECQPTEESVEVESNKSKEEDVPVHNPLEETGASMPDISNLPLCPSDDLHSQVINNANSETSKKAAYTEGEEIHVQDVTNNKMNNLPGVADCDEPRISVESRVTVSNGIETKLVSKETASDPNAAESKLVRHISANSITDTSGSLSTRTCDAVDSVILAIDCKTLGDSNESDACISNHVHQPLETNRPSPPLQENNLSQEIERAGKSSPCHVPLMCSTSLPESISVTLVEQSRLKYNNFRNNSPTNINLHEKELFFGDGLSVDVQHPVKQQFDSRCTTPDTLSFVSTPSYTDTHEVFDLEDNTSSHEDDAVVTQSQESASSENIEVDLDHILKGDNNVTDETTITSLDVACHQAEGICPKFRTTDTELLKSDKDISQSRSRISTFPECEPVHSIINCNNVACSEDSSSKAPAKILFEPDQSMEGTSPSEDATSEKCREDTISDIVQLQAQNRSELSNHELVPISKELSDDDIVQIPEKKEATSCSSEVLQSLCGPAGIVSQENDRDKEHNSVIERPHQVDSDSKLAPNSLEEVSAVEEVRTGKKIKNEETCESFCKALKPIGIVSMLPDLPTSSVQHEDTICIDSLRPTTPATVGDVRETASLNKDPCPTQSKENEDLDDQTKLFPLQEIFNENTVEVQRESSLASCSYEDDLENNINKISENEDVKDGLIENSSDLNTIQDTASPNTDVQTDCLPAGLKKQTVLSEFHGNKQSGVPCISHPVKISEEMCHMQKCYVEPNSTSDNDVNVSSDTLDIRKEGVLELQCADTDVSEVKDSCTDLVICKEDVSQLQCADVKDSCTDLEICKEGVSELQSADTDVSDVKDSSTDLEICKEDISELQCADANVSDVKDSSTDLEICKDDVSELQCADTDASDIKDSCTNLEDDDGEKCCSETNLKPDEAFEESCQTYKEFEGGGATTAEDEDDDDRTHSTTKLISNKSIENNIESDHSLDSSTNLESSSEAVGTFENKPSLESLSTSLDSSSEIVIAVSEEVLAVDDEMPQLEINSEVIPVEAESLEMPCLEASVIDEVAVPSVELEETPVLTTRYDVQTDSGQFESIISSVNNCSTNLHDSEKIVVDSESLGNIASEKENREILSGIIDVNGNCVSDTDVNSNETETSSINQVTESSPVIESEIPISGNAQCSICLPLETDFQSFDVSMEPLSSMAHCQILPNSTCEVPFPAHVPNVNNIVEMLPVDSVSNWPYLEEEVFSEIPPADEDLVDCEGEKSLCTTNLGCKGESESNTVAAMGVTGLKCRLSWKKIFDLSKLDERKKVKPACERKHRKEASRRWPYYGKIPCKRKPVQRKNVPKQGMKKDILDGLELGPAKIEVRLAPREQCKAWQVVDAQNSDKMVRWACTKESNNNYMVTAEALNVKPREVGQMPIVLVKRLILKRRVDDTLIGSKDQADSEIRNLLDESSLSTDCSSQNVEEDHSDLDHATAESVPDVPAVLSVPDGCANEENNLPSVTSESPRYASNESYDSSTSQDSSTRGKQKQQLPRVIIKRTRHGATKYRSFLRVSEADTSTWQPVVSLQRNAVLDNLAKKMIQNGSKSLNINISSLEKMGFVMSLNKRKLSTKLSEIHSPKLQLDISKPRTECKTQCEGGSAPKKVCKYVVVEKCSKATKITFQIDKTQEDTGDVDSSVRKCSKEKSSRRNTNMNTFPETYQYNERLNSHTKDSLTENNKSDSVVIPRNNSSVEVRSTVESLQSLEEDSLQENTKCQTVVNCEITKLSDESHENPESPDGSHSSDVSSCIVVHKKISKDNKFDLKQDEKGVVVTAMKQAPANINACRKRSWKESDSEPCSDSKKKCLQPVHVESVVDAVVCKTGLLVEKRHSDAGGGRKDGACRACGWIFGDKAERAAHIRQHPYHCQRCHLAFKSEVDFVSHLSCEHPSTREQHHCLLCERSFPSTAKHQLHLAGRLHRHLEATQRRTIHTLFTILTGHNCPGIAPLTDSEMAGLKWFPAEPGAVHFYHQATPLQMAVQDWLRRQRERESKPPSEETEASLPGTTRS